MAHGLRKWIILSDVAADQGCESDVVQKKMRSVRLREHLDVC